MSVLRGIDVGEGHVVIGYGYMLGAGVSTVVRVVAGETVEATLQLR